MKKIIALIASVFLGTAVFADDYINITVPFNLGVHYQRNEIIDSVTLEKTDQDYDEELFSIGVTGEYFKTVAGPFGFGVKGGLYFGDGNCDYEFDRDWIEYDSLFGASVALGAGWVFGDTTKKKITIYPVVFRHDMLSDGEYTDYKKSVPDASLDTLGLNVCFSWQWGEVSSHGFEIGFGFDYWSRLKYDDTVIDTDDWFGFNLNIGYKYSFNLSAARQ